MIAKRLENMVTVLFAAVVCVSMLNGCAALKNYPERPNNTDVQLQELKRYFDPKTIREGGTTTAWRDEVVNSQILAIDLQFTKFEQALSRTYVGTNTAIDMTVIGLGSATAIVGGAGTKSILGAISGGITGAKGIIDKDIFYSRTMPVLMSQMEAQRKMQLVKIRNGLKADASVYPLSEALIDVEEYYKAGSIPAALQGILEQSGAEAESATKELRRLTKASAENARQITSVRNTFNTLFNSWNSAPDSEAGKKALSEAKAILGQLRPGNQLNGKAVFEALDNEISQAEPGSSQLAKVIHAFSEH